jgi:hypothetical protein
MNGQIEELNRNLEVVKEKRATTFDERRDEQLTTKDKGIFTEREKDASNGELRKIVRCWLKENGTSSSTKNG